MLRGRPEIERVAFGRFDGRCEELAVAHRAVFREREIEASRRAGNIRGIGSFVRYLTELPVKLGGRARGRRTGAVEEDDTVLFFDVSEDESVSAETRLVLLYHGRHVEDGDRCVDGVTAGVQDFHPGHGFERVLGGHHAVGAHDDGPPEGLFRGCLREHRGAQDKGE